VIRRPENETDYLPSYSAETKNSWKHTSIPPYFMNWCLIKHRGNFTYQRLPLNYFYTPRLARNLNMNGVLAGLGSEELEFG
jgi:hypothetical protein